MCIKADKKHQSYSYTDLGGYQTIWAISSIHGDIERLTSLHNKIIKRFRLGDKILYLGNYTGYGDYGAACINEMLAFRRLILATPGVRPSDFTYLRGTQEEMMHKLLQLPFAPNPVDCYLWMLGNGLANTLYSYGMSPHDGIEACQRGIVYLTKWIGRLRDTIRKNPGHEIFSTQLVRAAYTDINADYPMLFVHAGLETDKPLSEQGDKLWWGSKDFEAMEIAYHPFQKVVRGYDPAHKGLHLNCITATIDAGCGFGGPLVCAGFNSAGETVDILESA